jgi:hypothetical protein
VWRNHTPLDRTLATVRWEASTMSRILGTVFGVDRVLSDAGVELLATTAWTSLRPAG